MRGLLLNAKADVYLQRPENQFVPTILEQFKK